MDLITAAALKVKAKTAATATLARKPQFDVFKSAELKKKASTHTPKKQTKSSILENQKDTIKHEKESIFNQTEENISSTIENKHVSTNKEDISKSNSTCKVLKDDVITRESLEELTQMTLDMGDKLNKVLSNSETPIVHKFMKTLEDLKNVILSKELHSALFKAYAQTLPAEEVSVPRPVNILVNIATQQDNALFDVQTKDNSTLIERTTEAQHSVDNNQSKSNENPHHGANNTTGKIDDEILKNTLKGMDVKYVDINENNDDKVKEKTLETIDVTDADIKLEKIDDEAMERTLEAMDVKDIPRSVLNYCPPQRFEAVIPWEDFASIYCPEGKNGRILKPKNYSAPFDKALKDMDFPCSFNAENYFPLKKGFQLKIQAYCSGKGCQAKYDCFVRPITPFNDVKFEMVMKTTDKPYRLIQTETTSRKTMGETNRAVSEKLKHTKASKVAAESDAELGPKRFLHKNFDFRSNGALRTMRCRARKTFETADLANAISQVQEKLKWEPIFSSTNKLIEPGYIRRVGQDPFGFAMYSPAQVKLAPLCDQLYIDSTGRITKPVDGKKTLLHTVIGKFKNSPLSKTQDQTHVPLMEFIMNKNSCGEIKSMLNSYNDDVQKLHPGWKPKSVCTDFSFAYLHAASSVFNNESLTTYINRSFERFASSSATTTDIANTTQLRLCRIHLLNSFKRNLTKHNVPSEVKDVAMHGLVKIQEAGNFYELKVATQQYCTLFGSKYLRESIEHKLVEDYIKCTIQEPFSEDEFRFLIKNQEDPQFADYFSVTTAKTQREKSKYYHHFKRVEKAATDGTKGEEQFGHLNKFFNPQVIETMRDTYYPYVALWNKAEYVPENLGQKLDSTAPVENYFCLHKTCLHTEGCEDIVKYGDEHGRLIHGIINEKLSKRIADGVQKEGKIYTLGTDERKTLDPTTQHGSFDEWDKHGRQRFKFPKYQNRNVRHGNEEIMGKLLHKTINKAKRRTKNVQTNKKIFSSENEDDIRNVLDYDAIFENEKGFSQPCEEKEMKLLSQEHKMNVSTDVPNDIDEEKPIKSPEELEAESYVEYFMTLTRPKVFNESDVVAVQRQLDNSFTNLKQDDEINSSASVSVPEKVTEYVETKSTLTDSIGEIEVIDIEECSTVIEPYPIMSKIFNVGDFDGSENDLLTLNKQRWLTDPVMNAYGKQLIQEYGRKDGVGKFTDKWIPHYSVILVEERCKDKNFIKRRFVPKPHYAAKNAYNENVSSKTGRVFIPSNNGYHWWLTVADIDQKTMLYFDSSSNLYVPTAQRLEYMNALTEVLDVNFGVSPDGWKFKNVPVPLQRSTYECGELTLMNARNYLKGLPGGVLTDNTEVYRKMICESLLRTAKNGQRLYGTYYQQFKDSFMTEMFKKLEARLAVRSLMNEKGALLRQQGTEAFSDAKLKTVNSKIASSKALLDAYPFENNQLYTFYGV